MVLFSPEKIDHARSEEYVMFAFNDMITNSNNLSLSSVYHVPSRYFMVICLLIITTTTWSSYYYSENTDKRRNRSLDMSSICLMTHCTNTGVGARFWIHVWFISEVHAFYHYTLFFEHSLSDPHLLSFFPFFFFGWVVYTQSLSFSYCVNYLLLHNKSPQR